MSQRVQQDPVGMDKQEARRALYVTLGWFTLVAIASVILLVVGANAGV